MLKRLMMLWRRRRIQVRLVNGEVRELGYWDSLRITDLERRVMDEMLPPRRS